MPAGIKCSRGYPAERVPPGDSPGIFPAVAFTDHECFHRQGAVGLEKMQAIFQPAAAKLRWAMQGEFELKRLADCYFGWAVKFPDGDMLGWREAKQRQGITVTLLQQSAAGMLDDPVSLFAGFLPFSRTFIHNVCVIA